MNPEELRQVWADAHRLLTQFKWSQAKVDRYISEKTGLDNLVQLVSKAFPAEAEAPAEKQNKAATAATHFGHGAAFGLTDEIAGAIDAMGSQPTVTRQGFQSTPIPGAEERVRGDYVRGRNESRDFLAQGREDNPFTAGASELAGALGSGALIPAGAAATGTDLLPAVAKSGAIGAGIGMLAGVGNAGDEMPAAGVSPEGDEQRGSIMDPMQMGEAAVGPGLLGGALGAGGAAAGRATQTWLSPAAARGEEIMGLESGITNQAQHMTGAASDVGEAAVIKTLQDMHVPGTPPPMLAEGGEILRAEATQFVARANPKAKMEAVKRVAKVLEETTAAKVVAQKAYEPLNELPIRTQGVRELIAEWAPRVLSKSRAKQVRTAIEEGAPLRFRDVNDVRIELQNRAIKGFERYKKGQVGSTLNAREMNEAENFLDLALRNDVPAFVDVQAEVAPFIRREQALKVLRARLGMGRGRVMPSAGTGAPTSAAKDLLAGSTYFRNAKAAQQFVDVLFTPREPEAQIAALHKLRKTFPLKAGGFDPLGALINVDVTRKQQPTE